MTPHTPSNHEVETFTGRYVDTKRPDPATICIEDIAHALSQICRYGGHCAYPYTVGQHSLFVTERLRRQGHPRAVQLGGLLHDSPEAYLGDIPRPMKKLLGAAYERMTNTFENVIFTALDLKRFSDDNWRRIDFEDPRVKNADNWALFVEAKHLLPSKGVNWAGSQLDDWGVREDHLPSRIIVPDYWRGRQDPETVEDDFLARYKELTS